MIFRRRGKQSKGFTLIEVLVVVAIIAILASVATVSVMAFTRSVEKKAASTALSTYWNKAEKGIYGINMKIISVSQPNSTYLANYLGITSDKLEVSKYECKSLGKDGNIYIQYTEDKSDAVNRFTLKKIWLNYKGRIYSTMNGTDSTGPTDKPE